MERSAIFLLTLLFTTALSLGCTVTKSVEDDNSSSSSSSTSSSGVGGAGGSAGSGGQGTGAGDCAADDAGPDEVLEATSDPTGGSFTLAEALEGLPEGPGPLRAIIKTSFGDITCDLLDDVAPGAVANFVGLARGRRPWLDPVTKKWVKKHYYDGLIFHRVIPEFMIQGGDPLGKGTGGPGYTILDEVSGLSHDPGTLSYAKTSAPNSQGSQFFVTEVATPHLDPDFTLFGRCKPISVVAAIAGVETGANDKPKTDVVMQVEITRCAP